MPQWHCVFFVEYTVNIMSDQLGKYSRWQEYVICVVYTYTHTDYYVLSWWSEKDIPSASSSSTVAVCSSRSTAVKRAHASRRSHAASWMRVCIAYAHSVLNFEARGLVEQLVQPRELKR